MRKFSSLVAPKHRFAAELCYVFQQEWDFSLPKKTTQKIQHSNNMKVSTHCKDTWSISKTLLEFRERKKNIVVGTNEQASSNERSEKEIMKICLSKASEKCSGKKAAAASKNQYTQKKRMLWAVTILNLVINHEFVFGKCFEISPFTSFCCSRFSVFFSLSACIDDKTWNSLRRWRHARKNYSPKHRISSGDKFPWEFHKLLDPPRSIHKSYDGSMSDRLRDWEKRISIGILVIIFQPTLSDDPSLWSIETHPIPKKVQNSSLLAR